MRGRAGAFGASGEFTASPLTGKVGQTVDYEIVVKNTGNVPLTLSNFSYDRAHVEAAITSDPDCDSGTVSRVEFDLAYNGTRVIAPPAGDDVCWRRDMSTNGAGGSQWSRWNRAYLSVGQSVDSRL